MVLHTPSARARTLAGAAAAFAAAAWTVEWISRAGVAVDADQRPLDASGSRLFENVLVAGATLAGAEPWREKSGDGLSLATGHRAAGFILSAASGREQAAAAATGG